MVNQSIYIGHHVLYSLVESKQRAYQEQKHSRPDLINKSKALCLPNMERRESDFGAPAIEVRSVGWRRVDEGRCVGSAARGRGGRRQHELGRPTLQVGAATRKD
jgi:hypothetical protein